MVNLLKLLIIALPFVGFSRFGPVKLSDFVFLAIIVRAVITGDLKLNRYVVSILMVLTAFTLWGIYRVNFIEHLTILGGWDVGVESQKVFQLVTLYEVFTYIIGGVILGRYLIRPGTRLFPFIYSYYIIWSLVTIALYLIPPTRPLMQNASDNGDIFFKSTFTEKGPFSDYCVFMFALLLTGHELFREGKLAVWQRWMLVAVTAANIGLARGDRSTITFLVFGLVYLFTLKPARFVKLLPVGLLGGLAITPLMVAFYDKVSIAFSLVERSRGIGRYATAILFPSILASSPWLGVGFSNYVYYRSSWEYAAFLPRIERDQSGEFYLQVLMETGVIGSIIIVALTVISPLVRVFRTAFETRSVCHRLCFLPGELGTRIFPDVALAVYDPFVCRLRTCSEEDDQAESPPSASANTMPIATPVLSEEMV